MSTKPCEDCGRFYNPDYDDVLSAHICIQCTGILVNGMTYVSKDEYEFLIKEMYGHAYRP